jgi:hypothetical protein
MPSRFEYERAVRSSDLPPLSRLLLLTLATWADVKTGIIPARLTPSLSVLEEGTGMDRSTVRRHLNKLEAEKWVGRDRPDVVDARAKKARTRYRLTIPKGMAVPDSDGNELEAENPEARGTQPLANEELGAHSPMARGTQPLELGAQCTTTRGTVPPNSSYGPERTNEYQLQVAAEAAPEPVYPGDLIGDLKRAMAANGLTGFSWRINAKQVQQIRDVMDLAGIQQMVDVAINTARLKGIPAYASAWIGDWESLEAIPAGAQLPAVAGTNVVALHTGQQRPSTSDLRSNQAVEAGRRIQALADAKRQQEN